MSPKLECKKFHGKKFYNGIKLKSNPSLTSTLARYFWFTGGFPSSILYPFLSFFFIFFFFCRFSALLPNKFRWWGRLEKDDMGKCGWANGGVKKWQSKCFSPQKKPAGSEKQRFTKLFSCDTKTSSVRQQNISWLLQGGGEALTGWFEGSKAASVESPDGLFP